MNEPSAPFLKLSMEHISAWPKCRVWCHSNQGYLVCQWYTIHSSNIHSSHLHSERQQGPLEELLYKTFIGLIM